MLLRRSTTSIPMMHTNMARTTRTMMVVLGPLSSSPDAAGAAVLAVAIVGIVSVGVRLFEVPISLLPGAVVLAAAPVLSTETVVPSLRFDEEAPGLRVVGGVVVCALLSAVLLVSTVVAGVL